MAVVGGRCLFKMPTMNEVPGSTEEGTVERSRSLKKEMATAQGLQRSFLPLKRQPLAWNEDFDDELSGVHHCKRFLSEELMAAHLRHLNLSSDSNPLTTTASVPTLSSSTEQGGRLTPYPCHLNIKTVASCPQSLDTQVGRKRSFPDDQECYMDEDVFGNEGMEIQVLPKKRSRLGPGMDSKCVNFKSDSKVVHSSVRSELDGVHVMGNMSDLSSIPEEGELTQQNSSPSSLLDQTNANPDTGDISIDTDDPAVPVESKLPSPQSLHFLPGLDGEVQSVWLAPELKAIKTHTDYPLPLSILKEIDRSSRGMELVPWVGGVHTALREGQKRKERKASSDVEAEKSCKESSMETN